MVRWSQSCTKYKRKYISFLAGALRENFRSKYRRNTYVSVKEQLTSSSSPLNPLPPSPPSLPLSFINQLNSIPTYLRQLRYSPLVHPTSVFCVVVQRQGRRCVLCVPSFQDVSHKCLAGMRILASANRRFKWAFSRSHAFGVGDWLGLG